MLITIDMFQLVGTEWLKNYYLKSFEQFHNCCGFCRCCFQMKTISDEFEKKGFDAFNSHVNCWKFYNFSNHFEILPCIETVDS